MLNEKIKQLELVNKSLLNENELLISKINDLNEALEVKSIEIYS